VPEGIVNDRWGADVWDYRTSEYDHGTANEADAGWEHCRGLGFSFGYNRAEDESLTLSPRELARLYADIVSRGGRLLLNVGPTAAGEIPAAQQESLRGLGRWISGLGDWLQRAVAWPDGPPASDEPWIRWLRTPTHAMALVDHLGETRLAVPAEGFDLTAATLIGSGSVQSRVDGLTVTWDDPGEGPAAVLLPRR
jgi:alpha-L-fucosidase